MFKLLAIESKFVSNIIPFFPSQFNSSNLKLQNKLIIKAFYSNVVKFYYSSAVVNNYKDLIKSPNLKYDEYQIKVLEKLNQFHKNFQKNNELTFFEKYFKLKRNTILKGVYLWGEVGSGV